MLHDSPSSCTRPSDAYLRGTWERGLVVLFGTLLILGGCSCSNEKSGTADARASTSKTKKSLPSKSPKNPALLQRENSGTKPSADEPNLPRKSPVDEFQRPAAPPPSIPLPKPKQEPIEPPATVPPPAKMPGPVAAEPARPIASPSAVPATPAAPAAATAAAAAKLRTPPSPSNKSKIPFNPIRENGAIFDGWSRPRAALVITGMEHGYLEPCGCAGLERMMGGMSRRDTFFRQLRGKQWPGEPLPVVGLDVGGLALGFGRQTEMKFQILVDSKQKMGYQAIAFGADDLRLPAADLLSAAGGDAGRFVSANVGLFGFASKSTPTSRVVEIGGIKIGVTAVFGRTYQKDIHNDMIEMSDPAVALGKIVPELKSKADYLVLLAHATSDESKALAKKFPEFRFVVTSDGPQLAPKDPETIEGTKTWLIKVGQKGMNAIVLGLYDDPRDPFRYQRVPLDSRFPPSADMKLLMAAYQDQLKMIGFADLGYRPAHNPRAETNGAFLGSKKCESCHEISYNIWKKSKHAKAYETLQKADPPRNFDPECVSCHVVGWHPTQYFPFKGGFDTLEKTPHLTGVGCENCHGPGEKHVDAELRNNEALQEKYRKVMVVTKEESKKRQCSSCHDIDNSPQFNFDAYWPVIEHKEKE
jgi:hypothetical protein